MELKIGMAIKKLRSSKNVTQEQLAGYLNVSFQAVSKWETGVTVPDVYLLPKIAIFFGVSIDDIFAVDDSEKLKRIMKDIDEPVTEESFAFARKTLEEILSNDEDNYEALNALAWTYYRYAEKHTKTSIFYAKQAIQVNSRYVGAYNAYNVLANALGAKVGYHWCSSGPLEMLSFCESYAHQHNDLEWLHRWLAELCIQLRDFERAKPFMATLHPAMQEIFQGDIFLACGKETEAKTLWAKAGVSDNLAACYAAGERFNGFGMIDEAIQAYEAAFSNATPPRDLSSTYSLAFLYTKIGKYAEAIAMWERILQVMAEDYDTTNGENIRWPQNEIEKLQGKLANKS